MLSGIPLLRQLNCKDGDFSMAAMCEGSMKSPSVTANSRERVEGALETVISNTSNGMANQKSGR